MDDNTDVENIITNIGAKNFTAAESNFNSALDDRVQIALDQAKVRIASKIFDDTAVETEEDEDQS
jgi:hypothetical protein